MSMAEDLATAFSDPHDPASCKVPGCIHGKWAEQIEMMRRIDPATVELISAVAPLCAGRSFEHHQDTVIGIDGWSCPACGASGSYSDFTAFSQRLISLMPLLDRLQEQMLDQRAVILVPTSGATGPLGTLMGRDVIRVPGLAEPMIGIPGLKVPGVVDRHEALASFVAEMEREQGPVSDAEVQAVREEWLG